MAAGSQRGNSVIKGAHIINNSVFRRFFVNVLFKCVDKHFSSYSPVYRKKCLKFLHWTGTIFTSKNKPRCLHQIVAYNYGLVIPLEFQLVFFIEWHNIETRHTSLSASFDCSTITIRTPMSVVVVVVQHWKLLTNIKKACFWVSISFLFYSTVCFLISKFLFFLLIKRLKTEEKKLTRGCVRRLRLRNRVWRFSATRKSSSLWHL